MKFVYSATLFCFIFQSIYLLYTPGEKLRVGDISLIILILLSIIILVKKDFKYFWRGELLKGEKLQIDKRESIFIEKEL
jgi:hypothetical protein